MNTDFENDLRTAMQRSADEHVQAVDLDAVLDEGRHRVRQRGIRRTAAATALALGVLAGGLGLAQMGGDSRPQPAQVPAVDAGLVGQQVTLTTGNTASVAKGEPVAVDLRVDEVDASGDVLMSLVARDASGARRAAVPATLPAGQDSLRVHGLPLCRYCEVRVVRGDVSWITSVSRQEPQDSKGGGSYGSGPEQLGSGALTAQMWWEAADGDNVPTGQAAQLVKGLVWRTRGGALRDSTGSDVAHAVFTIDGEDRQVWVDERLGAMGISDDGGTFSTDTARKDVLAPLQTGTGKGSPTLCAGVLPAGSTVVQTAWKGGERGHVQQQEVPGVGTVYLLDALPADGDMAAPVTLTYRTPDGAQHTLKA